MAGNGVGENGKEISKGLTVELSAILTVIWGGMVGYQVYAKYMIHEELFLLGMVGLIIGAVLTIAAMLWVVKLAEISGRSAGSITVKAMLPPPKAGEQPGKL